MILFVSRQYIFIFYIHLKDLHNVLNYDQNDSLDKCLNIFYFPLGQNPRKGTS